MQNHSKGGAFLTIGLKKQAQGKKCSVLTDFPYSIQKHLVQYTIEIDELPLELMEVKRIEIQINWNFLMLLFYFTTTVWTIFFTIYRYNP